MTQRLPNSAGSESPGRGIAVEGCVTTPCRRNLNLKNGVKLNVGESRTEITGRAPGGGIISGGRFGRPSAENEYTFAEEGNHDTRRSRSPSGLAGANRGSLLRISAGSVEASNHKTPSSPGPDLSRHVHFPCLRSFPSSFPPQLFSSMATKPSSQDSRRVSLDGNASASASVVDIDPRPVKSEGAFRFCPTAFTRLTLSS